LALRSRNGPALRFKRIEHKGRRLANVPYFDLARRGFWAQQPQRLMTLAELDAETRPLAMLSLRSYIVFEV
jgi:hypothetical protein